MIVVAVVVVVVAVFSFSFVFDCLGFGSKLSGTNDDDDGTGCESLVLRDHKALTKEINTMSTM